LSGIERREKNKKEEGGKRGHGRREQVRSGLRQKGREKKLQETDMIKERLRNKGEGGGARIILKEMKAHILLGGNKK